MEQQFGLIQFGNDGYVSSSDNARVIACVGDTGSHGGSITDSGGNSTFYVAGILVALEGAHYHCSNPLHNGGTVTAIVTRTKGPGGKLVITQGAQSSCGSVITPIDRRTYVE